MIDHEQELCGELVPRLFDHDVWADIERLDVQDTILVLRQAQDVIRKGLFDDLYNDTYFRKDVFEAATARLGVELCKKVMALPVIYTLIDDSTNLPVLGNRDYFYLFTEKSFADNALDYHLQQLRLWHIRAVEQKDIRQFLGVEFYCNGARGAIINYGQDWSRNKAGEFIPEPQSQACDAVSNPDYIRALTLMQQELHWRAGYEGKNKVLRTLEDGMIRAFASSRFLVPFKADGPLQPGDSLSFASVTGADGRKALPVFSDWDQFALSFDLSEWQGWVVNACELPELPAETVVLNLGSLAFAMNKRFIGQMLSIYRNELAEGEASGSVDADDAAGAASAPSDADDAAGGKKGAGVSGATPAGKGCVFPLKSGTLREKIKEMMDLAGEVMGRPANIKSLRKLYADEQVPLLPCGERFLARYAYLFSTFAPVFGNEDDDSAFYFDTFDELGDDSPDNYLKTASSRDWRATTVSGCPVTPVGVYGFREPFTVYAGEDGKLYAFKAFNDEVRIYQTLEELLEEALDGHIPIGLDD